MSHNVEKMFSVNEVPWHFDETGADGRAVVLDDYPQTWGEARERAGLAWEPEYADAFGLDRDDTQIRAAFADVMMTAGLSETERLDRLVNAFHMQLTPLTEFRRVIRTDTRATLSIPRETYQIISHTEFGEILEAVIEQDTNLKIETGGCLEGGRKVWMLVKLDEPILLPGDKTVTMPFLALTSRHDTLGSCQLRATGVRIVCSNTFGMAEMEGERTGLTYAFQHRGDWRQRIGEAREAVTGARRQIAAYSEMMTELLGIPVTPDQTERFIVEMIPAPPTGIISERVMANIEKSRQSIRDIIAGPTVTGADINGTAYGLLQAAGEYLDHVRRAQSWETRLNRTILRPEPLKVKAMKLAKEVALA